MSGALSCPYFFCIKSKARSKYVSDTANFFWRKFNLYITDAKFTYLLYNKAAKSFGTTRQHCYEYAILRQAKWYMVGLVLTLYWALLNSYRLSTVTNPLPVMVWPQFAMQILTWFPITLISTSCGRMSTMLHGVTRVSSSNGITSNGFSCRCTGVTLTDGQRDRPRYSNI